MNIKLKITRAAAIAKIVTMVVKSKDSFIENLLAYIFRDTSYTFNIVIRERDNETLKELE